MTIRTAQVGDIRLAYETFGQPGDPAVLLVMGLGTQMLGWDERFCQQVADAGFHVIRFDNRDVGLSTHLREALAPTVLSFIAGGAQALPYLIDDLAEDAVGLLDALGIGAAHVVGASMGGMIAQALTIRHPDRVLTLTSIMSTPSNDRGQPLRAAAGTLLLPTPNSAQSAEDQAVAAFRIIGSPDYPMDEARLRAMARLSYERAHDPAGAARQLAAILASPDRTPGLAGVTVPTLVIHGEADPLISVDGGIATAQAVPGARLVTIPGMGHDLPEALWPQIIGAILDLLGSVDPA